MFESCDLISTHRVLTRRKHNQIGFLFLDLLFLVTYLRRPSLQPVKNNYAFQNNNFHYFFMNKIYKALDYTGSPTILEMI